MGGCHSNIAAELTPPKAHAAMIAVYTADPVPETSNTTSAPNAVRAKAIGSEVTPEPPGTRYSEPANTSGAETAVVQADAVASTDRCATRQASSIPTTPTASTAAGTAGCDAQCDTTDARVTAAAAVTPKPASAGALSATQPRTAPGASAPVSSTSSNSSGLTG